MKHILNKKGFTLIELLVVIGIIAILAAIVIIAINPARQFAQARDAQRWNDVNAFLNAIHQQAIDNNGVLYAGIDSNNRIVGTNTSGCNVTDCAGSLTTQASCLNMTSVLVPTYTTAVPQDPLTGSQGKTDYYVTKDASTGRVTVGACYPEETSAISVTR